MPKQIVHTSQAPAAIGPYSQAVVSGDFLYCSGQLAMDPATGDLVGDTVGEQAEVALKNVKALLEAAGLGFADVVKATVFLLSMDDFAAMNEVYQRYFTQNPPARSTIAVAALPKGGRVEIEVIARRS